MTPGEPAVLNPIALEQRGLGENEAPGVPKGISAPSGCLKCRQFALAKAMLNQPAKNRALRAWATLPFGTSGRVRQTRDDGPAKTTRAWSVLETDANRTAATGAFGGRP